MAAHKAPVALPEIHLLVPNKVTQETTKHSLHHKVTTRTRDRNTFGEVGLGVEEENPKNDSHDTAEITRYRFDDALAENAENWPRKGPSYEPRRPVRDTPVYALHFSACLWPKWIARDEPISVYNYT